MASASRVCSSTMFNSFSLRRSAVSSNWKSSAHTWFGSLGSQQRPAAGWPGPLALARRRPAQPLVPPQPSGALAVDGVTLPTQDRVRGLPTPAWMAPGDLPQPAAQLVLLGRARPRARAAASSGAGRPPGRPDVPRPRNDRRARPLPAGVAPGSEVSLRQLLEHRLVQLRLGRAASSAGRSRARARGAASPRRPSSRRTGPATGSKSTRRPPRWRSTSVRSLPSFSSRSPSRSLRTICSGVCRCRFIVVSSCPACWALDSHNRWTTIRGPGQRSVDAVVTRPDRLWRSRQTAAARRRRLSVARATRRRAPDTRRRSDPGARSRSRCRSADGVAVGRRSSSARRTRWSAAMRSAAVGDIP